MFKNFTVLVCQSLSISAETPRKLYSKAIISHEYGMVTALGAHHRKPFGLKGTR